MVWIHCGLAQISRAFGQGAKSPTPRGRCAPRACKNLLQPSPLWLGFIVAWIGVKVEIHHIVEYHAHSQTIKLLSQLNKFGQSALVQLYFVQLVTCSITFLGNCNLVNLELFNMLFVQIIFVQLPAWGIKFCSILQLFN